MLFNSRNQLRRFCLTRSHCQCPGRRQADARMRQHVSGAKLLDPLQHPAELPLQHDFVQAFADQRIGRLGHAGQQILPGGLLQESVLFQPHSAAPVITLPLLQRQVGKTAEQKFPRQWMDAHPVTVDTFNKNRCRGTQFLQQFTRASVARQRLA
ncbi:hypothetical protein D3C85_834470 [compost metagenome]